MQVNRCLAFDCAIYSASCYRSIGISTIQYELRVRCKLERKHCHAKSKIVNTQPTCYCIDVICERNLSNEVQYYILCCPHQAVRKKRVSSTATQFGFASDLFSFISSISLKASDFSNGKSSHIAKLMFNSSETLLFCVQKIIPKFLSFQPVTLSLPLI